MSFVCCISTTLFSEFSVVCKTNIIWFGVGKCFQDHWKKIPILVYIILETSANVKELFVREVILQQFLKRKKWALLGKNVQAILTLLNSAKKVLFLEDLKKKVYKSDWKRRHIVYDTQIRYYALGRSILKSCSNFFWHRDLG